jgi:hypothetical protein
MPIATFTMPDGVFSFYSDGAVIYCQDEDGVEAPFTLPLDFPQDQLQTLLDAVVGSMSEGYRLGQEFAQEQMRRAIGL